MLDFPEIALTDSVVDADTSFVKKVLQDFWIACISREASILGRKEVLTGKAKFGILGDGKELPQIALAHFFKKGDFRSGYYRDQTWMMALGLCSIEAYFAQLYADPKQDPFSGGRQMNNHFATPLIDSQDNWTTHTERYNVSADISSTGGQMARALGLAMASKKYRALKDLDPQSQFSDRGNEVVFCSIGDASTSEGIFWETLNAAAVSKVPLAVVVWDDGYGISVPKELQTTKGSISEVCRGFEVDAEGNGIDMYEAKAWDYPSLVNVFDKAAAKTRAEHRPCLIHIQECTQPQGHSTSGSHERYKTKERLAWEEAYDCINKMEEWILSNGFTTQEAITKMRADAKAYVKQGSKNAWTNFQSSVKGARKELVQLYKAATDNAVKDKGLGELESPLPMTGSEVLDLARRLQTQLKIEGQPIAAELTEFVNKHREKGADTYNTKLYSDSERSALNVPAQPAEYSDASEQLNGYQVINAFFDQTFERYPEAIAFGEDVGHIGDVNQGFAGLQDKYGIERVFDTGIREWSIMGQAIGLAMRGFRPIAEIQYLDYLIYGMSPLSDDLATLRYRSNNQQMAPAIIRTRGHRLEGIWHAGSPLGMMINSFRGLYICVPRNFVQAAGMYNTLLQSTDPAIVVEVLNGYRLKETKPDNLADFTVPLGSPEVMTQGTDLTIVTYGACVRYAQEAIDRLSSLYSIELIDVQTLIPFDMEHTIVESLKKTSRVLFFDEDVPGGATAYMMQQVLELQGGYFHLDAAPKTLTAKAHRCAFGSDGDYFSKPQVQDVVDVVMEMMEE